MKCFGLSDIGVARPNNEDVWIALPEIGFFALADGMGGHQAGEIAAAAAIEHLSDSARKISSADSVEQIESDLYDAIERANTFVHRMSLSAAALHGMGTTICCIYWTQAGAVYAHVGDSRIYRFRKGKLEKLTEDHSLLAKWLATGKMAQDCKTPFPYKNIITRAVGNSPKANPEIAYTQHEPGDLFLLCTDGLSDVLQPSDIEKILETEKNLEDQGRKLIEKAKLKGSHDNITLLLIQNQTRDDLSRQQCDNSPRSESAPSDALRAQRSPG